MDRNRADTPVHPPGGGTSRPTAARGPHVLLCLLALLCSGCTTLPSNWSAKRSYAFGQPETTWLGKALASAEQEHPGQSGFRILEYGLEALVARAALADAAERTIDVQYYIYESDTAGGILGKHLLAAADRGVRVRLLLDDYNLASDKELKALCAHPNIQVRIFNPVRVRPRWAHLLAYLLHWPRADRRMHNKLFVVDNEIAILGGRNIGNDYFDIRADSAFRDFDVLIAGSLTRQASGAFDEYWNCPWAVPATAFSGRPPTAADLWWLRRRIESRSKNATKFEQEFAATRDAYLEHLEHDSDLLSWANGEIVSDPPQKVAGATRRTTLVAQRLDQEWRNAKREILIEAAYFIPGSNSIETFRRMRGQGVSIRAVTSASEATDVPIVFCGYRKCRRDLLAAGVELYEYKINSVPYRKARGRTWYHLRPRYGALHSKVIVFDRRRAWIGSFNLDRRSVDLDTEIAVVVNSAELSSELADCITEDCSPLRSWRVRLQASPAGAGGEAGEVVSWTGAVGGKAVTQFQEPASLSRRLDMFLLSLIPVTDDEL